MSISLRYVVIEETVPYRDYVDLQRRLVDLRIGDAIDDVVLVLEHDAVVTMGIRASEKHLVVPRQELARRGVDVVETNRGGDVTYHGPGQIVVYPVMKLAKAERDVHGYVSRLEEVAIRFLADYGVSAFRRKGLTGAWTKQGKVAAIGVHVRRWVTSHGMSININVKSEAFDCIVPCGLQGEVVTSLFDVCDDQQDMELAGKRVIDRFSKTFGRVSRVFRCEGIEDAEALLTP